jgi:hypothetical protein
VSGQHGEESIAERLEGTEWEYSQHRDKSFLLTPIGEIFASFCWDGNPERIDALRPQQDRAEEDPGAD